MKKPYLIFIAVACILNAFIYFYPADIFPVEMANGLLKDVTLKDMMSKEIDVSINDLTFKGWFLLFICSVGIPAIIAWRSTLTKYNRRTGKEQKSIYDKLK